MTTPFTLGIERISAGPQFDTYVAWLNGVAVEQCIVEWGNHNGRGNYTALTAGGANGYGVWINRMEWRTSKGGTLLGADEFVDASAWTLPWDIDAGHLQRYDGGFGSHTYKTEPAGTEYAEIQGVYFNGEINYCSVGVYIHCGPGVTDGFAVYYDLLGGNGATVIAIEPYEAHVHHCDTEVPISPPVVETVAGRPPFHYNPPIETLREQFKQIGLGRG